MKRLVFAVFALLATLGIASALSANEAKDWRTDISINAQGTILVGNPAAPVKLAEYLSYTCPHCAHFTNESETDLVGTLVRDGKVQIEMHAATRDALDFAAAMLVRCVPHNALLSTHVALMESQEGLLYQAEMLPALKIRPDQLTLKDVRSMAENTDLSVFAKAAGMDDAAINRCYSDAALLNQVKAQTKKAWSIIKGTPSFAINDKPVTSLDWQELQPKLQQAGA